MPEQRQSLLQIFLVFCKIGAILIGGGIAMLPILQKEVVEKKGWLDQQQFIDMIAITNSSPGPFALNAAVFLGYRLRKVLGAVVAIFAVVSVPLVVVILLANLLLQNIDNVWVNKFFAGARPAVAGMIIAMVIKMASTIIKSQFDVIAMIVAFVLLLLSPLHPFLIIVAGAVAGILFSNYQNKKPQKPDRVVS
ncbi:MAG: chromate transporter [Bacillota bacterium]|jgi:chromate transporter